MHTYMYISMYVNINIYIYSLHVFLWKKRGVEGRRCGTSLVVSSGPPFRNATLLWSSTVCPPAPTTQLQNNYYTEKCSGSDSGAY